MEDFPNRKDPRIKGYPYDAAGCYFITVCAKGREHLFFRIVGRGLDPAVKAEIRLKLCGKIACEELLQIPARFAGTHIDNYVVMPDHLHILLTLDAAGLRPRPTVPQIIGLYKSGVSRRCGRPVWQTSFYDHIIRNRQDYEEIWNYIDNNPLKWLLDGKG